MLTVGLLQVGIAGVGLGPPAVTLPDDNTAIDIANGSVYECATLTANRTKTISTTGALEGARIKIRRRTADAFTLDVGGLITMPAVTKCTAIVRYTSGAWVLDDTWLDIP